MSIGSKRDYLNAIWVRYRNSSKKEKTLILNEFCENCRYSRKYAIFLLSRDLPRLIKKRGPKPTYGPKVDFHLEGLWKAMGKVCSKKIAAALPIWLPFYRDPSCTSQIRIQLLAMGSSTIDRHLRPFREPLRRGLSTTRSGWIKTKIPIELLHESKIDRPGYLETDTVGHCGDCISGAYAHSVTMTDLASSWTENRAVWTKGSDGVVGEIRDIDENLPFLLLGVASDSGTEFINTQFTLYLQYRPRGAVKFVRRRPYRKNDNAHVEQKNWVMVRQLFGYERFDDESLVPLMNDIYKNCWNPLINFFIPNVKLIQKTRIGSKIKKVYDKPKTSYQRLLESDPLSILQKNNLQKRCEQLNPFALREDLERKLKIFFNLVEQKKRRIPA